MLKITCKQTAILHVCVLLALGCLASWYVTADDEKVESQRIAAHKSRQFHFTYETQISDIPNNAKQVRVWIPIPQSDENQTISNLKVSTVPEFEYTIAHEEIYGNKYLFLEALSNNNTIASELHIKIQYDVARQEATKQDSSKGLPVGIELLSDDVNAPITPEVRKRSVEAIGSIVSNDKKAGAIFDRVLFDVTYDKSGTGWGEGDINYVCEAGAGNCSDFHTLFIAMARAADIPAYFEIGFSIPPDTTSGEITGYHCWAWFQNDHETWMPIDASEADKHPELAHYYFGTLSADRLALSRGRDLVLSPEPAQGPINFFIYPVVEIDGKDVTSHVKRSFNFK